MNSQNISQIVLKNSTDECEKLAEFLSRSLSRYKLDDETRTDLRLTTEEIFINIIDYAYRDDTAGTITVELTVGDSEISLTFIDSGIAFDPLAESTRYSADNDNSEGGMGIHIIRSLTDTQSYKRIDQHNVFTVTKNYTC